MSRADQASEPSMEDILASIRRIIADDEPAADRETKTAEPRSPTAVERENQRHAGTGFSPPPGVRPAGTLSAFSGRPAPRAERPRLSGFSAAELTPQKPATPSTGAAAGRSATPDEPRAVPVRPAPPKTPPGASAEPPVAPADEPSDDVLELTDELILLHPDDAEQPRAPEPASRPETGNASSRAQPVEQAEADPAPREGQESLAPFGAAAERDAIATAGGVFPFVPPADAGRPLWSRRDVAVEQASNPEKAAPVGRGGHHAEPESPARWPGDFQAQIPLDGPRAPFGDFEDTQPLRETRASGAGDAIEETVGTLARSVVTGLRDDELVEAQQVDFGSLDAGRRDAVAQSFIRAVASRDMDNATVQGEPGPDVWAVETELPEQADDEIAGASQAKPSAPADAEPAPALPAAPAPAVARVQPQTSTPHPVATATFAVPAPGQTAARPLTLEDSVREMLRPMLAEWLNQHMPRILEDAIRQEIKARGLPWDGGKKP